MTISGTQIFLINISKTYIDDIVSNIQKVDFSYKP
ncbi:MAG: hypothetical protein CM15mV4_0540 [Caudoviricetes sp.]|nr:MAG: hypothetical protein CM15mV4_0540 [Caudoviricetes sp.]